jgi:hypothetical protein
VVSGLNDPFDLAVDSSGRFYTTVKDKRTTEDYATYDARAVVRVTPGNASETLAEDLLHAFVSVDPKDVPYVSDFYRAVIFKIEDGVKVEVTRDSGLTSINDMAFDRLNRPYFTDFRRSLLRRLDPGTGTTEAVTPWLGDASQTIATDASGRFYLSTQDYVEDTTTNLFMVDPMSGTLQRWPDVPWTRALRFDAFDRLIVVKSVMTDPSSMDTRTTLGIVNLETGQVAPYVVGNDLTAFMFDHDQNLLARYRRRDGIIKVNVLRDPADPPFDTAGVPLFYDLRSKNSEIRYFDMNALGQLLIPLVDTGEIVIGQPDGQWGEFASGFDWPNHVRFDLNGVMYVVDGGTNAAYRVIGQKFVVPATSLRLADLAAEVRARVTKPGIANSLTTKLLDSVALLTRGNIKKAIAEVTAFTSEVRAQGGKQIPTSTAETLIATADSILAGLRLL